MLHPMKQAWNIWNKDGSFNRSRGFRWGIVGFGSQFRPKDGSTVLSVGGNSTNSELNWFGGAQGWTDDANQGSSWLGTGAGNGATGETNDHNFSANIAGNQTTVQSRNTWTNGEQYSVYAMGGNGKVNWNQSNTVISGVKNPSTGSDYTYSEYKNYVTTLSGKLAKISSSNTVTKGNEDNYTGKRYSYSYNTYANNVYRFDIENNSRQTEITLTGDGKDELQVFNLDASMLNSIGDAGVVFNFKNISDNASVAININGNGNDVKFRNGWQFKWNDVDISDGYVMMNSTGTNRYNNTHGQEYVKRASQLMWNFYNTNTLTILGGKGSGRINTGWYKDQKHGDKEDWYGVNVTDDPSAAWMGSVMVTGNDFGAKGNFQSHVSTNGRVWTTGDFEMYNKDVVTTNSGNFVNAEGKYSTSAVDMDQERHNLSWYGQMTTSCAAIKWDKVDAEGKALKGTSWTVYGTRDNAMNGTNPITTVADGGWNDADDADNGSVTLGSLAKKATYYLKESGTGSSQYALNTNIYRIVTHDSTDTVSTIDKVYDADGTEITDDTAKQLNNGAIVNKNSGTSIAWSKVDGTDGSTLLAGSTWELTKKGDPDQSWTITDDDSGSEVAGIKVTVNGQEVTSWRFTNSTPASITYVAVDKDGKELATKVQWRSEDPAIATIANNGTQLQPNSSGFTNIVFTAGDKTVTFPVTVSGVTVESSVSIGNYTEGQKISLEQGKTMTLTATVAPEGNTVNWSSSNTDEVSVSPSTGTAVTVTAKNATSGYVTITATEQRSQKKATLKIKVTKPAATTTTVYFKMQDDFNQNNGQKLFLEWKYANGSWPADKGDQPNRKQMTTASGCGEYVSYTINSVMPSDAIFRIRRDKANWTTPQSFYRPNTDGGYSFNGGDVVTLESNTNVYYSAPSGCTVTSAYVENRSHRSTVKNAVFYDQPVVRAITNTTAKAADTRQDEDPKGGQFKVSDLTDGTYTLKETSAPNGFDVSKTKTYTIVIENGQVTSSGLPSAGNIENSRLTGTVNWKKTDETDTSKLLAGSEWKLYKTRNFSWDNGNAVYTETGSTDPVATIKDCVNSSEKTCSAQTGQYTDRDGEAGKFSIVGLEWGEYQLVESKAPDGYNIDTTPHVFRIGPAEGANVKGEWYTSSGFKPETTAGYQKSAAFTVDGGSITNTPGVVLPGTGGEGVNKMYAAGFLAVAIAVAGLALSLRRRQ
ncbi:SpaA isopeptide-forming pilin-related protein [Bifidobacterium adolescentis]|uniref:SpaA isopeptide-forming pilin-related protein n=2 Tax=Bifidobacterium adolescentis TaxID=1680 RepID=UPI00232B462F|nr:SpaA isopeptide-forming pilin-related protein [Bifidobacterium adolescentis]MDB1521367.1 SpaA isopeptide-forming pilin-related protein [Bifidobacterium adolescentis]